MVKNRQKINCAIDACEIISSWMTRNGWEGIQWNETSWINFGGIIFGVIGNENRYENVNVRKIINSSRVNSANLQQKKIP